MAPPSFFLLLPPCSGLRHVNLSFFLVFGRPPLIPPGFAFLPFRMPREGFLSGIFFFPLFFYRDPFQGYKLTPFPHSYWTLIHLLFFSESVFVHGILSVPPKKILKFPHALVKFCTWSVWGPPKNLHRTSAMGFFSVSL